MGRYGDLRRYEGGTASASNGTARAQLEFQGTSCLLCRCITPSNTEIASLASASVMAVPRWIRLLMYRRGYMAVWPVQSIWRCSTDMDGWDGDGQCQYVASMGELRVFVVFHGRSRCCRHAHADLRCPWARRGGIGPRGGAGIDEK